MEEIVPVMKLYKTNLREDAMNIPTLEQLGEKAQKVIDLKKLMDESCLGNWDEHLKLCIMAVILDSYREGYKEALEQQTKKVGEK